MKGRFSDSIYLVLRVDTWSLNFEGGSIHQIYSISINKENIFYVFFVNLEWLQDFPNQFILGLL